MSKRPHISDIVSGYASASVLNDNFVNIMGGFDNTVSLDGSSPNAMQADFDLNSFDLLNGRYLYGDRLYLNGTRVTSVSSTPDWKSEWTTSTSYIVDDLVREGGSVYICLEDHTSGTFSTDLSASKWELFASKGSAGAGTGDMLAANNLSDVSDAVAARSNLGVAATSHSHAASDITSGTLGAARIPSASASDYLSAEEDLYLEPDKVWDSLAETTLTDAANISWDMSTGINFKVTLGGNRTLDLPTNVKAGQSGIIRVIQDGTGSRTLTLASGFKPAWGVAPVMDTTAGAEDFLTYHAVSSSHINITHVRFG